VNFESKKVIQNVLLLIGSTIFFLILLEVVARAYSWKVGKGFWARPNSFNSHFFTAYDSPPPLLNENRGTFVGGQTVTMEKAENEIRIISLGGSTTVNRRNKEKIKYTSELQAYFEGKYPQHNILVLNAGADSYSSAHSLVNLSLRLYEFNPDIITVYHGINDLTARQYGAYLAPDYSNKYLSDKFLSYEHRAGFRGAVWRYSRLAQIIKWKFSVVRGVLNKNQYTGSTKNAFDGPKLFRRNLESMVALNRHNGVETVLITQAHKKSNIEDFILYNNEVIECGLKNNVPVVDAARELTGDASLFLDRTHLTSKGVRKLTQAIAPQMEEILDQLTQ
jgi:lysophospholipase L1-like esterase